MTNEKKFRVEADLLGELQVPADALYGVQTQRGINNYHISRKTMSDYPDFIIANAYVKLAAAQTNHSLGVINDEISGAISEACREIIDGKWHENFPIDMIQGGAGTSVNMNVNEVIANRALEIMGHEKGEYQYCSPNDHVNCGQSTNDAYPTSIRLALIRMNIHLVGALTPREAARFFPVYRQMMRKMRSHFDAMRRFHFVNPKDERACEEYSISSVNPVPFLA